MSDLDRLDQKILDGLQKDGRMSITELGEHVGLSTSACAERVRRLERDTPGVSGESHSYVVMEELKEDFGLVLDR